MEKLKFLQNFFLLILLLLFSIGSFAQKEENIIEKEKSRIKKAEENEQKIEKFINNNIKLYKLNSTLIKKIETEPLNEVNNLRTSKDIDIFINELKRDLLRKLYFKNNPNTKDFYIANSLKNTSCFNGDFEAGTIGYTYYSAKYTTFFSDIYGSWGLFNNFIPYLGLSNPTLINPSPTERITLVDNSILDPFSGLPRVYSGNYSIRLNRSQPNIVPDPLYYNQGIAFLNVSALTKKILITEPELTFKFQIVTQDPSRNVDFHDNNTLANPYFQYRLVETDANGDVTNVYLDGQIVSDSSLSYFHQSATSPSIYYTNWICQSINTSDLIGKNITFEIYMSDCGKAAHFGYAYIDDICGDKCDKLALGSLFLNPISENCPTLPYVGSGNIIPPDDSTITGLSIDVLNDSNQVISTVNVPLSNINTTVTPNTFYYTLNSNNFNNTSVGVYNFVANATFTNNTNGSTSTLSYANPASGITFSCCEKTINKNDKIKKSNDSIENLIEKIEFDDMIKIVPNPNKGIFKIIINNNNIETIKITDSNGNIIFDKVIKNAEYIDVNISSKPKGIYFVSYLISDQVLTKKIIIE